MSNFEQRARTLGAMAFERGVNAPALDPAVMDLIREAGVTKVGNPMTTKILTAWINGWDIANLDAPVPGWTDEENDALRSARAAG